MSDQRMSGSDLYAEGSIHGTGLFESFYLTRNRL